MNEGEPAANPKAALRLGGPARPVTRINRKVLILAAACGGFVILALVSVALSPPTARGAGTPAETYNTTARRTPDGLADLPASYADWTPGPGVPALGAPMAGDLGGTIVAEEREWGLEPDWDVAPSSDFRPSSEDEAARAARLSEVKMADAARKSGLFFDVSARPDALEGAQPEPGPGALGAELLALAGRGAAPAPPQPAAGANLQDRKRAFADSTRDGSVQNPHDLEAPLSPWQVMAGTVIPAALLTALNSDLPGTITAQITRPVHDTVTGTILLIPQGARLIGRYQAEISPGQDRALIVWDRLIFPDGTSIRISEPGTDAAGAAGLTGRTDNHWDRVIAAAGLATLLGVGAEIGQDDEDAIETAVRRGLQDTAAETGGRIVDRSLSIQPTLRVRAGTPLRVLVTRDLVLRPYRKP